MLRLLKVVSSTWNALKKEHGYEIGNQLPLAIRCASKEDNSNLPESIEVFSLVTSSIYFCASVLLTPNSWEYTSTDSKLHGTHSLRWVGWEDGERWWASTALRNVWSTARYLEGNAVPEKKNRNKTKTLPRFREGSLMFSKPYGCVSLCLHWNWVWLYASVEIRAGIRSRVGIIEFATSTVDVNLWINYNCSLISILRLLTWKCLRTLNLILYLVVWGNLRAAKSIWRHLPFPHQVCECLRNQMLIDSLGTTE